MLLSTLIASTKTLSVHPRYSLCFPLTHVPGQRAAVATNTSAAAVPVHNSRQVPLSSTDTMHTARERTSAMADHCSRQAVMPAKCVPLELPLSNCNMWPQHRAVAFSLSLWLRIDGEMELTTVSDGAHSLDSESTTDLDFSPTGTFSPLSLHASFIHSSGAAVGRWQSFDVPFSLPPALRPRHGPVRNSPLTLGIVLYVYRA